MKLPDLRSEYQLTVIFIVLCGAAIFTIFTYDNWFSFGVPPQKPIFVDQYALLAASDCDQQGFDVYSQNPCDPFGRPHVYPRVWLQIFQGLNLHVGNNTGCGIFIAAAFLLVAAFSLRPKRYFDLVVSLLVILSPAVLLGVERGNSDLLLYAICTLAILLLPRGRLAVIFSYLLIMLAVSLKLYPAAILTVVIYTSKSRKYFWLVIAAFLVFLSTYLAVTYNDFIRIIKIMPRPDGFFITFGLQEVLKLFHLKLSPVFVAIFISLVAGAGGFLGFEGVREAGKRDFGKTLLFLAGSSILAFCFFVNTNFHYRAVYFLCCLPFLLDLTIIHSQKGMKIVVYLLLALALIFTWTEFFIALAGKPAIASFLKINLMAHLREIFILKHLSSLGVVIILQFFFFALIRDALLDKFNLAWPISAKE